MILTVTCNPAVDVTYVLDRLEPGRVHRVETVHERPGGKGVNVARVLHQLGEDVLALGLADDRFAADLREHGIAASFLPLLAAVRRTVVLATADGTTSLWEPGPTAPATAAADLSDLVSSRLPGASALVVSGSLPPGLDPGLPAELARLATRLGVPSVLDLDGPALEAAPGSGAVLTPNLDELARIAGGGSDLAATARELAARNGAPVVLTLGEHGLLAAVGDDCWHARPPEQVRGNPTGAGDATAAGLARGLANQEDWPKLLAHATALGAAAVVSSVAGEVDLAAYRHWAPQVRVEPVQSFMIGDS